MPTILLKKSDTASAVPTTANLTNLAGGVEVAVNTADRRMFTMTSASAVVELGTNPSSLTLTGGTANGVLYLNGSKVATSGSALTFNGTALSVGTTGATTGLSGAVLYAAAVGLGGQAGDSLYIRRSGTAGEYQFQTTISGASSGNIVLQPFGGNLGLGVTPSPSSWPSFENTGGTLSAYSSESIPAVYLTANAYFNSSWKYKSSTSNKAFLYEMDAYNGNISWKTAGSGTAGNNITFTTAMTLDSSGNLGLGVTPSAWGSNYKALESTAGNSFYATSTASALGSNAYNDNSNWRYKTTAAASLFATVQGQAVWLNAPSGTAGNAITFTQAMTLNASGNLLIGTTSASGARVDVYEAGSGNATVRIGNAQNGATLDLGKQGSSGYGATSAADAFIYNNGPISMMADSTGIIKFSAGGNTERARITAGGNLLVGTTTDVSGRSGVISDISGNVRAIPRTGSAKTAVYTLTVSDVGQFVELGTGGGIDVPNGVFSTGDVVSVFNNTTGNRTISLTITTAYIGGTDSDKASVTLATRGVATVLFISNSVCVVSGNVT